MSAGSSIDRAPATDMASAMAPHGVGTIVIDPRHGGNVEVGDSSHNNATTLLHYSLLQSPIVIGNRSGSAITVALRGIT